MISRDSAGGTGGSEDGGLAKDHPPHPAAAPRRPPPPPSPPRPPTRRIALPAAAARIPLTPEVGSQTNVVAFQQLVDGLLHKGHVPGVVDAERGARGTENRVRQRLARQRPARTQRASPRPARFPSTHQRPYLWAQQTTATSTGAEKMPKSLPPAKPHIPSPRPGTGEGAPRRRRDPQPGLLLLLPPPPPRWPGAEEAEGEGEEESRGRSGPGGRSPGAGALGGRRRGRSRPRAAPAPYESPVAAGLRAPFPAAVAAVREVRGGAGMRPQIRAGHCGRGPRLRGAWQGGGWATKPAPLSSLQSDREEWYPEMQREGSRGVGNAPHLPQPYPTLHLQPRPALPETLWALHRGSASCLVRSLEL